MGSIGNTPSGEEAEAIDFLRARGYTVSQTTLPEVGANDPAMALAAKLNEIDAARYRWLNKKYDLLLKVGENDDDYTKRHVALKCGPELDRWIDARLAEETPSPPRLRNQCDGCARGLAIGITEGQTIMHYETNGLPVMACTKELYSQLPQNSSPSKD